MPGPPPVTQPVLLCCTNSPQQGFGVGPSCAATGRIVVGCPSLLHTACCAPSAAALIAAAVHCGHVYITSYCWSTDARPSIDLSIKIKFNDMMPPTMNDEEETCQDGDGHEHEKRPAAARLTGKSGGGDVTVSKEAGKRAENGVVDLTKCVVYLSLMLIEKDHFSNYGDDDDDEYEKEESRSDCRLECVNANVEFFVTHTIPHPLFGVVRRCLVETVVVVLPIPHLTSSGSSSSPSPRLTSASPISTRDTRH